jgi:hypothetical protein
MSDAVATQFIRDDLASLALMLSQSPLEETLRGLSITPVSHEYINHFTILVSGPPQIMLLSMDLNEHLINEESINVALVFSSKTLGIFRTKLITPLTDGCITDRDAPLRHQVFDVAVTRIESMLEPQGILNDSRWESVAPYHF